MRHRDFDFGLVADLNIESEIIKVLEVKPINNKHLHNRILEETAPPSPPHSEIFYTLEDIQNSEESREGRPELDVTCSPPHLYHHLISPVISAAVEP